MEGSAMTTELWQRVEQMFHAALEQPDQERSLWLRQACGSDTELLEEVEGMLSADRMGGLGLEKQVRRTAAALLLSTFGASDPAR
jgi:hypothetical protein